MFAAWTAWGTSVECSSRNSGVRPLRCVCIVCRVMVKMHPDLAMTGDLSGVPPVPTDITDMFSRAFLVLSELRHWCVAVTRRGSLSLFECRMENAKRGFSVFASSCYVLPRLLDERDWLVKVLMFQGIVGCRICCSWLHNAAPWPCGWQAILRAFIQSCYRKAAGRQV